MKSRFASLSVLLTITICFGGLTAGTHAGLIYNTFPYMNGHWLPEEIFTIQPFWQDIILNPATIQFCHRLLAFTTLGFGFYLYLSSRTFSTKLQHVSFIIAAALSLQVILGVATLVLQVPIWLGVIHQIWAAVTLSVTFWGYLLSGGKVMENRVALANA